MKFAVISLGSKSSLMVIEALKKYSPDVDDIHLKDIEVSLSSKGLSVLYNGKPLGKYDCIYAKGSFRYSPMLRAITLALSKDAYMPQKPETFTKGNDKIITYLSFQKEGVPMPTTYLATGESSKKILAKVHYPIIMKFPHGTQGKGVMFAESYAAASSMLDALLALKQPFLIQEYIETEGTDIRAFVVGDKVAAAYRRVARKGEKRANIHAGGTGEVCTLDAHTQKVAIKAAKAIGAEIAGVDILESVKGPVILEINVSPGLQGITSVTKIDVADKIAKFLFEKTKEFIESKTKTATTGIMKEITPGTEKEIITALDFRGERILLPEYITKETKFKEAEDLNIKVKKGKLIIEKFSDGHK